MLKYEIIKEYLKSEITKPEAVRRLPTVRGLMRKFNVSMATVNRALLELEHENVILRKPGSRIVAVRDGGCVRTIGGGRETREAKRTVVFAVCDYPSDFIWNLSYCVEQRLLRSGFRVVPCKIYRETTVEQIVEFVHAEPECSGLILLSGSGKYTCGQLKMLQSLPFPVILLDSLNSYEDMGSNLFAFSPDPVSGVKIMVEALLRAGHTRIGYVRNEPKSDYNERYIALLGKALRERNAEFAPDHVFAGTIRPWADSMEAAQQLVRDNLDRIRELRLTALIFTSSQGAFAAIPVLEEAGLRVPEEISVTGENDSRYFQFSMPPLTVATMDCEELARSVLRIFQGEIRPGLAEYPRKLIVRRSIRGCQASSSSAGEGIQEEGRKLPS